MFKKSKINLKYLRKSKIHDTPLLTWFCWTFGSVNKWNWEPPCGTGVGGGINPGVKLCTILFPDPDAVGFGFVNVAEVVIVVEPLVTAADDEDDDDIVFVAVVEVGEFDVDECCDCWTC